MTLTSSAVITSATLRVLAMTATRGAAIDPDQSFALSATLEETVVDLVFVGEVAIIPLADENLVLDVLVGPTYP